MAEDVGETRVMSERTHAHVEGLREMVSEVRDDVRDLKSARADHTVRIERLEKHAQERRDLLTKLGGIKAGWLLAIAAAGAAMSIASQFIE